jgi:hypothetical protein
MGLEQLFLIYNRMMAAQQDEPPHDEKEPVCPGYPIFYKK